MKKIPEEEQNENTDYEISYKYTFMKKRRNMDNFV